MAVESGGNCALSVINEVVTRHGVIIVGFRISPLLLSANASQLFATNISTLLLHLADKEGFEWDMEEEVTKGSLITHEGATVHESTNSIISKS